MKSKKTLIRSCCLTLGENWTQASPEEVIEALRLAKLSAENAGRVLGYGIGNGRTVRRWRLGETKVPHAAWAILCDLAGLGRIWRKKF